ncbi:MAG: acyl-CoA reductase-like NAD-dependent aldehyde dehydrogenase [Planctomycetota bacterium]|jgi:acyl-CoA reductase-like NAD-dependent aldehyde dehydrogenase
MTTFTNYDPATGEAIAEISITPSAELGRLVSLAREAQPAWAQLSLDARGEMLRAGAAALGERTEELANAVTREMGKCIADARREASSWVTHTAEVIEEVAEAIAPQDLPGASTVTTLERHPLGVVAAITPWNFPVGMPLSILIPALATGNTVVFKPSELVPETGAIIAECFASALPDGVLNLVQGDGEVGAALVASDVDMIGFVGSLATGQKIMKAAGDGLKRLILELGGKDPLIVFDDADLEDAAECAVRHSLRNTGQVCCSVERVYVAESIAEEFERLVVSKASDWNHGSGFDEGSKMGPMVSAEQRGKVAKQVDQAVAAGARLLLGGKADPNAGYFYPATVLGSVEQSADITREETFGPVVALTTFDNSEAQAVQFANDTAYGLGASVYTKDLEKGMRVARQVQSGQVGVNQYLGGAKGSPWVGARQSGFGFLGGIEGHRQFTVPKTISYPKAK